MPRRRVASTRSAGTAAEWWVAASLAVALLVLLATQYADVFGLSFSNDDFLILNKLQYTPFRQLWLPHDLLSNYYRPWSRELHYWIITRLFGITAVPFHAASLMLFLVTLGGYFALVRRLAGSAVAGLAVCLVATQAAWGTLLVWPAGSQDLWMLAIAPLFLMAFIARRTLVASIALAVALLSKETVATLPLVAAAYALIIDRESVATALRRTIVFWPLVAGWAILHPYIGGGYHPAGVATQPPLSLFAAIIKGLVNVDETPISTGGWWSAVRLGLPAVVALGFSAILCLRSGSRPPAGERTPLRAGLWLACWAVLGWVPLLASGIRWHPYYSLWGSLGAFAAAAIVLRRAPWLSVGLVIVLALLRPIRATTTQVDLGSEWYQRRAATLTRRLHEDLVRNRRALPRHSRVYFSLLPSGVGMVSGPGYSAPLKVWYADTTLRGYLYSRYAPRTPADTLGGDFFFVSDTLDTGHLTEVIKGPEDVSRAAENPDWRGQHAELGRLLFRAGDLAGAAVEFEKLANVYPNSVPFAYDAAVCHQRLGDTAAARLWLQRAADRVGAATPRSR